MLSKEQDSTCDEPEGETPLFCTLELHLQETLEIKPAKIRDTALLRGKNTICSDTKAQKAFSYLKLDSQARNRWTENHRLLAHGQKVT